MTSVTNIFSSMSRNESLQTIKLHRKRSLPLRRRIARRLALHPHAITAVHPSSPDQFQHTPFAASPISHPALSPLVRSVSVNASAEATPRRRPYARLTTRPHKLLGRQCAASHTPPSARRAPVAARMVGKLAFWNVGRSFTNRFHLSYARSGLYGATRRPAA